MLCCSPSSGFPVQLIRLVFKPQIAVRSITLLPSPTSGYFSPFSPSHRSLFCLGLCLLYSSYLISSFQQLSPLPSPLPQALAPALPPPVSFYSFSPSTTLVKPLAVVPRSQKLPTTSKTIAPADLHLPVLTPDSPASPSSEDLFDSPFAPLKSLPFPLAMDASSSSAARKSPDFGSLESSPPHFSYEFTDTPGNPAFEFPNYIYTGSPRMDFASLTLNTANHPHHHAPFFTNPSAMFSSHPGQGTARTGGGSGSGTGSPTSLGPHTPLAMENVNSNGNGNNTIAPPLTYPHHHDASGSELDPMDEATASGSTSPAGGRSMPHHQSARAAHRFTPMPPRPTRAASKRSATATRRNLRREDDDMSDEDGDGANTEDATTAAMMAGLTADVNGNIATPEVIGRRREEIRRQRIESEQRRRDELREGYAKLKHTLPVSNQKSSKVSLLDRAVTYIRQLESNQTTLTGRLSDAEDELKRQRTNIDNLMKTLTEQHRAVGALAAAHVATTGNNNNNNNNFEPASDGSKKGKRL